MTGQKKTMEGGMIGLTIKNYNNVSINDLAKRIIEGKYGEESKWWNRIANNLRAEQRIKPFFKKLIQEIESDYSTKQMTTDRINKLFAYFKGIIDKYPDEINYLIMKEVHGGNTDFSKAKEFFINQGKSNDLKKIFEKLKKNKSGAVRQNTKNTSAILPQTSSYMPLQEQNESGAVRQNTKNTSAILPQPLSYMPPQEQNIPGAVPQPVGQNTSAIVPELVNKNIIDKYYEELIKQLDVIINKELKKPNVIQKINIGSKTLILTHISNLANQIKKLVNIYKLPKFKNEQKAKILIEKLSGLISIYRSIMSNNSSNNKQKANNLDSIYTNLRSLNA